MILIWEPRNQFLCFSPWTWSTINNHFVRNILRLGRTLNTYVRCHTAFFKIIKIRWGDSANKWSGFIIYSEVVFNSSASRSISPSQQFWIKIALHWKYAVIHQVTESSTEDVRIYWCIGCSKMLQMQSQIQIHLFRVCRKMRQIKYNWYHAMWSFRRTYGHSDGLSMLHYNFNTSWNCFSFKSC